MSNNFFDMVKEWTVNDYRTPGIKAEVILDMLISEFVEDIISYHYGKKAVLLAKEFPIRTNDDNYLNAKVDYLVCIENEKLLLVELKTAKESFSRNQKDRMQNAAEQGAAKLIEFYENICNLKKGNSLDCKKYKYSHNKFKEKNIDIDKISDVDYLYMLLLNDNIEKDKQLVLIDDYCLKDGFRLSLKDSKRRELWDMVSKILLECADNF